jgi:hypothetical protein
MDQTPKTISPKHPQAHLTAEERLFQDLYDNVVPAVARAIRPHMMVSQPSRNAFIVTGLLKLAMRAVPGEQRKAVFKFCTDQIEKDIKATGLKEAKARRDQGL